MKTITITLPDDVAETLSIRAAIDDMRLPEAIEILLCELVQNFQERRAA